MAERLPPSQVDTPLPGAGMPVGEDLIEEVAVEEVEEEPS